MPPESLFFEQGLMVGGWQISYYFVIGLPRTAARGATRRMASLRCPQAGTLP
jgi:hypothetical protein